MKHTTVSVVLATTLVGCLPVVENLTKRYPVDPALPDAVAAGSGSLLVMPVWYDDGPCNLRSAFVMPSTELLSLGDQLPARQRLGAVDFMGHGPSHSRSVMGILVLGTTGRAHWVDTLRYPEPNSPDVYWRPRYVAQVGIGWRGQLQAWLAGANDRPGPLVAISELSMVCEGFHALLTKSETSVAIDFLYELDLSESSSDHERWYESPAMSVPP